jgi:hypothetical protein
LPWVNESDVGNNAVGAIGCAECAGKFALQVTGHIARRNYHEFGGKRVGQWGRKALCQLLEKWLNVRAMKEMHKAFEQVTPRVYDAF